MPLSQERRGGLRAEAQRYDLVLVAVGRGPNGKKIGADKAGAAVTDRGFIESTSRCAQTFRTSSRSAISERTTPAPGGRVPPR